MKRSSIVLISLALMAVLAGAWFLFWPRVSLPQDPLAAVPADAYGVVRIRVDRVLASEAWKRLVVERGQAKGIERVQVTCGFNPLERLTELTVFARPAPGGGVPKFAFAARGDLRHEELIDCVKKFTGGDASALTREDIEGIPTVQSKKGNSRAAFVGRDGVIGGDAESVSAAIQTLLGKAPSLAGDPLLKGLFNEIEQGSDITIVSRLPDDVKPIIGQIAAVFGPPLRQLENVRFFGANLTTGAGNLTGSASLVTPSAEQAASLVNLGKVAISRLLDIPGIGFTPAASVLRGIQTEARGDRATFAGSIKVSTIEALLEFVPALEGMGRSLANEVIESDGGAQVESPGSKPPTPTVEPIVAPEPAKPTKSSKRSKSHE
ncbi:MAG: hypothetical protein JWN04_3705 [Myxococcaceae bacterium]|nr:hypothetical protein [Myxococcaceae bacterium]